MEIVMTNEWTYRRLRKNFKTAISDMKTKPGLLKSVVLNRSNQVLYKEEEVIPIQTILEDKKAKIRLVDKQVSDVAYDLACIHSEVAVMNFMGTDSAYENGKDFTWEGELCRCTTLFPNLCTDLVQQKFYQHNKSRGNSLGSNRAIYIPEIELFRTEMYRMDYPVVEPCFINVIGMAAPDMSRYLVEMSGEALKEIIKVRIERAFQIAYSNGNQAFLTGAWGCGESKCAPDIVAKAYAEVLEKWQYYFKEIVFTIDSYESSLENDEIYSQFKNKLGKYFT